MTQGGTKLRDYSADSRMIYMSGLAVIVGCAGALLSWALLRLIYLCTNLFYFHRWNAHIVDPGANTLGWKAIFLPVIGGLLVGVIAWHYPQVWGNGHEVTSEIIKDSVDMGQEVVDKQNAASGRTTAVEQGDSIRFEQATPFGKRSWVRKKTELNDSEQKIWDLQQKTSTASRTAEKE